MDIDKTMELSLDNIEQARIAEIKSLSYLERLERLMIIIEVSYTLKMVNRIRFKKQSKFLNNF
ncbi:hypothetical protein C8C83_0046 [Flavobacterium sp. 90]|nr:hypothetical protein C8C82_0335 [Flavobacterium sp. 81]TCK52257.1 hypothetical protein C8C83_0046 [Flavobacterium sp. 90]